VNRRVVEALKSFNRSMKRQRFVEDQTKTDENVAHRRTCEMCTATEDDASAKYCAMCGKKLAEIEGYTDEDEIAFVSPFPGAMKSPHSASDSEGYSSEDDDEDENEDEDEKRLRGGYSDEARRGARTGGYGMRSGESQKLLRSALKTFRETSRRTAPRKA